MNQLLSSIPALAFLAPVFMLWSQIKELMAKMIRLIIADVRIDGQAGNAILYYLRQNGKKLPTNVLKYVTTSEFVKSKQESRYIVFEGMRDLKNQWFWYKGTLITLSDMRGQDKETGISREQSITIRFMRGTLDYEKLISLAVDWTQDREKRIVEQYSMPRFYVSRFVGTSGIVNSPGQNHLLSANGTAAMPGAFEDWRQSRVINHDVNDIGYAKQSFFHVFNENGKKILEDVSKWYRSKTWYRERGLVWRRGALLFGPPGSGKSSLIRKIGQTLDIPVCIFELGTMTDQDFLRFWNETKGYSSAIIVMEDIDTVFYKRRPANPNVKLSFETLLNCISGVEPAEGVYLFVTTNQLDALDDALGIPNEKGISTRPGRLDTCFEIGEITKIEKQEMAKHFLNEYPEIAEDLIEKSNGCTAAQFNDMCVQTALKLYWEKNT